ncbi:MAG: hypothetical protein ACW990_14575 [Promethearchaeota archaeon]
MMEKKVGGNHLADRIPIIVVKGFDKACCSLLVLFHVIVHNYFSFSNLSI